MKKSPITTAQSASPPLNPAQSQEIEELKRAIASLNHRMIVSDTKIEMLEGQISAIFYMLIEEGFLEQLDKAN